MNDDFMMKHLIKLQIKDVKAGIVDKFLEIEVLEIIMYIWRSHFVQVVWKQSLPVRLKKILSSLRMKAQHCTSTNIRQRHKEKKENYWPNCSVWKYLQVPQPVNVFHCVLVQRRPPWWHSAFGIDLTRANTFYLHTFLNGQCNYVQIIFFLQIPLKKNW